MIGQSKSSSGTTRAGSTALGLLAVSLLAVIAGFLSAAETTALPSATVGMPVTIEQLVLPGSEVEPIPLTDKSKVVIRIDAVYPHGSQLRYDLICYGLEPGEFDLRTFFRRKDGSTTDDLTPLAFKVASLLPPGQIEPHELAFTRLPWLGGYRLLLLVGAGLWSAERGRSSFHSISGEMSHDGTGLHRNHIRQLFDCPPQP